MGYAAFLVFGVLIALLFALRATAPAVYLVHAATPKALPRGRRQVRPWPAAGLIRDERGRTLDLSRRFIGVADGDSMVRFGIPSGTHFVADEIDTDEQRAALGYGSIVVVDDVTKESHTGSCLRRIESVDLDRREATFLEDGNGNIHETLSLDKVSGVVSKVITAPGDGVTLRFIRRWLGKNDSAKPRVA